VSKKFSEWYQKTNKTGDTNKLTLLAFKIIIILHNTLLATFIKLLETVSKVLLRIDCRKHTHCQLAPMDFFLFPRLKRVMKGARFAGVAAIQECVTVALQLIPRETFADSFQKLYERCQQCVVKDGDYFEGQ
jgi:hypothetical protein